jgi:hypothetical protein
MAPLGWTTNLPQTNNEAHCCCNLNWTIACWVITGRHHHWVCSVKLSEVRELYCWSRWLTDWVCKHRFAGHHAYHCKCTYTNMNYNQRNKMRQEGRNQWLLGMILWLNIVFSKHLGYIKCHTMQYIQMPYWHN